MTRINCVPPSELCRQHLIAEYREITRVFKLAEAAYTRGWKQKIHSYRLGTGHVEFFYDKLGYIRNRHQALCVEMESRGYTPTISCREMGRNLPDSFQKDWTPTDEPVRINRERILERMPKGM